MSGDEKKKLKKNCIFQAFKHKNQRKVEGINFQDNKSDPGGPLFRRKNKKSQKGVPSEGVTPHTFYE